MEIDVEIISAALVWIAICVGVLTIEVMYQNRRK